MNSLDGLDISALLPPSLLLPPRLAAHKYIMVCTLTVAAWDTLVLSPRTWKLVKSPGWPFLKITYHILRYLMPIEFTIVAVAFFDSKWSLDRCGQFYLFEPVVTAILMVVASLSLAVRLYAIHNRSKAVAALLGTLFTFQVIAQAVSCAFYHVIPLKQGQGCIAGPRANWVGVYWLAPTIFYTAALALAIARSVRFQVGKSISWWKLSMRDGLNLYAAIWLVNMINVCFWFIVTPQGPDDAIKTMNTSITAVLTTTMTLRVILAVKGSLASGGAYGGALSSNGSSGSNSKANPANIQHQLSSVNPQSNPRHSTSNQIGIDPKAVRNWAEQDEASDDGKSGYEVPPAPPMARMPYGEKAQLDGIQPAYDDREAAIGRAKTAGVIGVKVTVDRDRQL